MTFNPELLAKKKQDDKKIRKIKGQIPSTDGADLKAAQQRILTEAEEIIAQEQRKKERERAAAIEDDMAGVEVLSGQSAEEKLIEEAQMGYAGESIVAQQVEEEETPGTVAEPEPVLMGEDPYIKAESDYAIARAEELERNREIDPVYEAVLNKFLLDTEKYRRARSEVFHRLEMDRGELKAKADRILQEVRIKLGRKYDDSVKLSLKDVLMMKELEADRERLKQLFREGYFLSSQVEEYREEMMRSQRRFRDTNDSLMRSFIQRSADLQQLQLREVKMQLPVSLDFYLEETSEEDFRKGKAQSPVDRAVVESIGFFKSEAENVPEDFLKSFSVKEAA
jgi:hypothetical protein